MGAVNSLKIKKAKAQEATPQNTRQLPPLIPLEPIDFSLPEHKIAITKKGFLWLFETFLVLFSILLLGFVIGDLFFFSNVKGRKLC